METTINTQLTGFYDKVQTASALQQQLMAGSNGDVEAILRNAVALGGRMGYRFSIDEARSFSATLEVLPDDMLDFVNAGTPTNCNSGTVSQV